MESVEQIKNRQRGEKMNKKILYIPLDERPCNYRNIIKIMEIEKEIELIYPDESVLSQKKKKADVEKIWKFVEKEITECQYAVIASEMLCYGGLLPSRIHDGKNSIEKILKKIMKLKEINPKCKIFISSLIMRTPQYSSSEQEPDYYEEYGRDIFRYGVLKDKEERMMLTEIEKEELKKIKGYLPKEYIEDFENRRQYNRSFILGLLELVKNDYIDTMVIPQDDSYEYGYTAIDQKIVYKAIQKYRISNKVLTYSGADETGYTLVARCINEIYNRVPKIYAFYSTIAGEMVIPKYEDRAIGENLKSHILAVGGRLVEREDEADIILAYNTPPLSGMLEANQQFEDNIDYDRNRNLAYFVNEISYHIKCGKSVSICDCAYANGGDFRLLTMLKDSLENLYSLKSYHAWNTNCNTLGSSLAESCIFLNKEHSIEMEGILLESVFEDIFYEGVIRNILIKEYLPKYPNISYFNISNEETMICDIAEEKVKELYKYVFKKEWSENIRNMTISFPWSRLFNADFKIEIGG